MYHNKQHQQQMTSREEVINTLKKEMEEREQLHAIRTDVFAPRERFVTPIDNIGDRIQKLRKDNEAWAKREIVPDSREEFINDLLKKRSQELAKMHKHHMESKKDIHRSKAERRNTSVEETLKRPIRK